MQLQVFTNAPRVLETDLPPVVLLEHTRYEDARGWFSELWRADVYRALLGVEFVQDNVSCSRAGTLRGLHFQYDRPQGKLITVLAGRVFDVAVDIRRASPTFGQWTGVHLAAAGRQLFIPAGFAHGFLALEDSVVQYKCTDYFEPGLDAGLRWDDPAIAIDWPATPSTLSPRDAHAPLLRELNVSRLPSFPA